MPSDVTPFKGRPHQGVAPTTVLRRFAKAGHVAEIQERAVSAFNAMEFIVVIDGSLLESQLFHGRRLADYPPALEARAKQLADDDWIEQPVSGDGL